MGVAYGICGGGEKCIQWGNIEVMLPFGRLGVDENIQLI